MPDPTAELAERALRDEPPTPEEARRILDGEACDLLPLVHAAFVPRERHFDTQSTILPLRQMRGDMHQAGEEIIVIRTRRFDLKLRRLPEALRQLPLAHEIGAHPGEIDAQQGALRLVQGRALHLGEFQGLLRLLRCQLVDKQMADIAQQPGDENPFAVEHVAQ